MPQGNYRNFPLCSIGFISIVHTCPLPVVDLDITPTFFCLTVLTIGWERNLTTVNETQGSAQLCLRILDVLDTDDLTGFSVMLFIGTIRGTAAGKLL